MPKTSSFRPTILTPVPTNSLTRVRFAVSHGGKSGDEKGRDKEYMQLAQMFKEEYLRWVNLKKSELNYSIGQGWGTVHSEYVRFR